MHGANEWRTEHGIHDEEVWHYSYWWRGRGLLVGLAKKRSHDSPFASYRIFSGVLCYEGEIDDGLLLWPICYGCESLVVHDDSVPVHSSGLCCARLHGPLDSKVRDGISAAR